MTVLKVEHLQEVKDILNFESATWILEHYVEIEQRDKETHPKCGA